MRCKTSHPAHPRHPLAEAQASLQGSEFAARTMRLIYAPDCGIILSEFIEFDGESIAQIKVVLELTSPFPQKMPKEFIRIKL